MGAPTTFWNQDFDNNDRYHMLTLNADIAIWCDMITRYDIVDALCIHNYSVTYDAFIYDFIATCCTRSNSAPRSLLVKQLPPATKSAPGNAVLNVSSWSSVGIDSPSSLDWNSAPDTRRKVDPSGGAVLACPFTRPNALGCLLQNAQGKNRKCVGERQSLLPCFLRYELFLMIEVRAARKRASVIAKSPSHIWLVSGADLQLSRLQ